MEKVAQLIKDHLNGEKSQASKKLFNIICAKLKEAGYKAPFKLRMALDYGRGEDRIDSEGDRPWERDVARLFVNMSGLLDSILDSPEIEMEQHRERIESWWDVFNQYFDELKTYVDPTKISSDGVIFDENLPVAYARNDINNIKNNYQSDLYDFIHDLEKHKLQWDLYHKSRRYYGDLLVLNLGEKDE